MTLDHYIYSYKGNTEITIWSLVTHSASLTDAAAFFNFTFHQNLWMLIIVITCFSSNVLSALIFLNSTLTPSGDSFLY